MRRIVIVAAGIVILVILVALFVYMPGPAGEEQQYYTEVSFINDEGETVRGYLAHPGGNGPYPAVVLVHGGPGGDWNTTVVLGSSEVVRKLVEKGFIVLAVDYGPEGLFCIRDFCLAGDDVNDTVAAVKYLKSRNDVNSSAISLLGASHGGYTVLYAAELLGNQILAVVDCYGPVNVTDITLYLGGVVTDENRTQMEYWSPITWIDNISCPVLLIHGVADTVIPVNHSDIFALKLKQKGKTHQYLRYADPAATHGFALRKPGHETPLSDNATTEIVSFLVKCTNGEPLDKGNSVFMNAYGKLLLPERREP